MSVLSSGNLAQMEDQLVNEGLLTASKLKELKQEAEKSSEPLMSLLVNKEHISNETLTRTIAHVTNIPYANLSEARIDPEVLALLPRDVAERYMAVPLGEMQQRLVVAMLDAGNVQAVDFLSKKIGRPLKVYAASEEGIHSVLRQYEANIGKDLAGSLEVGADSNTPVEKSRAVPNDKTITTIVQDSPISKALSAILDYAARNRASDVHIEAMEHELKIRCRVDGVLREIMKLPKNTEAPLISRIKILANLKIDEHRVPQDGQFTVKVGSNYIDLRIAISPVVWGEQVVIRLLDKSGTSLKLEDMGYHGRALRTIRKGIAQPNGMILTSGPTGSGKSTSLYALMQEIKNDSINIVSL